MNSAADAIATLRARLAQLEARADARRTRDAERAAEPVRAPAPAELPLRDNGAGWMAAHGRDWKAEALADLDAIKPTDRPARFGTAPEYREEVAQETPAEAPAQPVAALPEVPTSVAEVPTSAPAEKPRAQVVKMPVAVAREDWRVRMHRIDANALRASLAPAEPLRGPFDGLVVRAGAGPPA